MWFLSVLCLGLSASATDKSLLAIKEIVKTYQKASAISMSVDKKVYFEFKQETKKSSGQLYFSKGRLRLEIDKPEASLLILANDVIWMESHRPKEFGGGVQVTQIKASKQLKESNALVAFLFDDVKSWDKFKVDKSVAKGEKTLIRLLPIKQKDLADVAKIEVVINKSEKRILGIAYWDQLDNRTQYAFSKINFSASVQENRFSYSPPENAEVTKL